MVRQISSPRFRLSNVIRLLWVGACLLAVWVTDDYLVERVDVANGDVKSVRLAPEVNGARPDALNPSSFLPGTWISAIAFALEPLRGRLRRALTLPENPEQGRACPTEEIPSSDRRRGKGSRAAYSPSYSQGRRPQPTSADSRTSGSARRPAIEDLLLIPRVLVWDTCPIWCRGRSSGWGGTRPACLDRSAEDVAVGASTPLCSQGEIHGVRSLVADVR